MRNRQIIQYLIYPKIFNAYGIQYKGTYAIALQMYQKNNNNKINHAYPFLVQLAPLFEGTDVKLLSPSCHQNENFTYQTQKFQIIFEEDVKFLMSMCIFRLQFDMLKKYDIFLSAKLLRKLKNYSQEAIGFCSSKRIQNQYQTLDQQVYQIKKQGFNLFQRLTFRNCQFFCSIDINICTFNLGYKLYRNKKQISNYFKPNERIYQDVAENMFKQKIQLQKSEEIHSHKQSLLQDYSNGLPTYYYQLLNIYKEYEKWQIQCYNLYNKILECNLIPKKQLIIPSLTYVIMKSNRINFGQLSHHYQTQNPAEILINILQQKELLRKNVRYLRQIYCNLIISMPNRFFTQLINRQIAKNEANIQKIFVRYEASRSDITKNIWKQIRQDLVNNYFAELKLCNQNLKGMPILIAQNYDKTYLQRNKGLSLTVLVHGYQGNSFDFQKSKNYLKKQNSNTQILISQSITEDMNQSISSLGEKVAKQVREHIRLSLRTYSRINFIGFSLGGIIARSAFAKLSQYWPIFGVFITFSSPHLGLSQSDNNLVNIGVWFLIKIDNVKNLKELNFQSVKFEESLLSKLSLCQGLSNFKKVILVCSKDDGFVPFYSTSLNEKQCQKQQIRQLCMNMLTTIRRIERVELVFDVEKAGTFDKLTGRKGHIQFLENDNFLQTFYRIYGKFL